MLIRPMTYGFPRYASIYGCIGAMWAHFYDPHYEEIRVGLYALELTTEQWDTRRFQGLIIDCLARGEDL